jgi:hypothetical protein
MSTGAPRAAVSDLVEPLITVADALPAEVRMAGRDLFDAGAVILDHVGDLSVTAHVADDAGVHRVALASTADGLASSCQCERGSTGLLCPHSLATAMETWHRLEDGRA